MSSRLFVARNGTVDLEAVVGITGDSYHAKVAMRGGQILEIDADQRMVTNAWVAYMDEQNPASK